MALCGMVLTFLPQESLVYFLIQPLPLVVLALQLTGGLYLGFAMVNWMGRNSLIGGIYGRPVALGNFLHFLVAALALIKAAIAGWGGITVVAAAAVYAVFAVWFGFVVFGHPAPERT